jgi:murein hydrolase activator
VNVQGGRLILWRAARLGLALALGVLAAGWCADLAAQQPAADLKSVEDALRRGQQTVTSLEAQADENEAALAQLRRRLVGLAGSVRERESTLARLEKDTRDVEAEEAQMLTALHRERETVGHLLAALQRLRRYPPELMMLRGDDPLQAVRGAALLGATLPGLERQAASLRGKLDDLRAVRARLDARRGAMAQARGALGASREELEALIAERERMLAATRMARTVEASHVARLAARADDLRDLQTRLEAERRKREAEESARLRADREQADKAERQRQAREALAVVPAPSGGASAVRLGRGLVSPVSGSLERKFGQRDDAGVRARGVSIAVAPGITVVSPAAGRVAFAGPFRDFGQILIVEHRGGYHSLLVGFGRVDAEVGQRVAAGEPIGVAPGPDVATRPILYYELRRNGEPVDPAKGLDG